MHRLLLYFDSVKMAWYISVMTDDSITTPKTSSKKAYHHGDLRQQLVDQAARMIRDEGEAALSMRKLAAAVGVSRTAPYHHFEDKHALLCAIAEEGFRRFDGLGEGREEITDILDHLQQHIRGYVSFAVECPEYYDLMFSSHIWKSNALTESLRKSSFRTFRLYVEQMAGLCERYNLPEGVTPLRFTQVTWSTMHGLSRLMVDGIYVEKEAIDGMCDAAAKVLAHGLSLKEGA